MEGFVDIASVKDVPVGRVTTRVVDGRKIALGHTAQGFFALDNTCPHRGGPLGEGDLIGEEIICPWHLWGFDVATGFCGGNPEISVVKHEVRVQGDRILVKLAPRPVVPELL